MLKLNTYRRCIILTVVLTLLAVPQIRAQVQIGGDFMMRSYSERFSDTLDDRDNLNYMRYLGRIYLDSQVGENASFRTDLVTISGNPVYPARTIAGTGKIYYGISQIYGEFITPKVPLADLTRFRFGRQHYEIGQGLTLGDSYYQTDRYDGMRMDLSRGQLTLGMFGAITGQELTEGGFYPEPESDQLYAGKLEYEFYNHTVMAYTVFEKPRGDFNDNIVSGFGSTGSIRLRNLKYFGEIATQRFNTLDGLQEKGGMAYMAGLSYLWAMGPFRQVKVEVRTAGYEGDDASTDKIEIFEPFYPNWYWGDRTAYVNGSTGGDYSHRGIQVEGSRIWFWRVYVSPKALPKARLEFQYAMVDDWVNNDDYLETDNEFGFKLYYQVSENVRIQGRYFKRMANDEDFDLNNNGVITSTEDRYDVQRFMLEFRVQY